MALQFDKKIAFLPIPAGPVRAARQAILFQKKLQTLGSLAALKDDTVQAMYQAPTEFEPTELNRLRSLLILAHQRDELEEYVAQSFAKLGFSE